LVRRFPALWDAVASGELHLTGPARHQKARRETETPAKPVDPGNSTAVLEGEKTLGAEEDFGRELIELARSASDHEPWAAQRDG
jgi:hypothetical protein